MEELLIKLRREKIELFGKIKRLESFRGTDEWKTLSVAHKQLLDIQLQSMKTYLEALIGRCLDIEEHLKDKADGKEPVEEEHLKDKADDKEPVENESKENDDEDPVKVIIIGLGE